MDDFDRFWACYPRHIGKKDAVKAWTQLTPSPELTDRILNAVWEQIAARVRRLQRRQWVPEWPYAATWLRKERWMDELEDAPRMTLATEQDMQAMRESAQARWDAKRARDQAAIKAAAGDS